METPVNKSRILVVDDSPSILRVVENALTGAGFDVATTVDATQAAATARKFMPDLILLDFMMPRMNGYQVCKLLRDDPRLRDTPVVLMCTKGDGAVERFVQTMGVADTITKPFSPEAVLAVASYVLDKHARPQSTSLPPPGPPESPPAHARKGNVSKPPAAVVNKTALSHQVLVEETAPLTILQQRPMPPVDDFSDLDFDADAPVGDATVVGMMAYMPQPDAEASSEDDDEDEGEAPGDDGSDSLEDVKEAPQPAHRVVLHEQSSTDPGEGDSALGDMAALVAKRVHERMPDVPVEALQTALEDVMRTLPPVAGGAWNGSVPAMWGDLSQVPIPEVFQLMTLQGQTGLFQVWTEGSPAARPHEEGKLVGAMRFDVYFSGGKVDFVHASNLQEDFLLGRFLVSQGAIDKTELDTLLRARKGRGKLLGQQLVALGYITKEQLLAALRDQSSELVFELLRLRGGAFVLRKGRPPAGEMGDARLAIPVDELLLEGLRRVDEWGMIEKEITSFELLLESTGKEPGAKLTSDEGFVLTLVGPDQTVRHIVNRSGMRPFDCCKILYRLVVSRHLRRVE